MANAILVDMTTSQRGREPEPNSTDNDQLAEKGPLRIGCFCGMEG